MTLGDYAGDTSHPSFLVYLIIWHEVRPAVPKDPPQRFSTKDIESVLHFIVQRPCLTSMQQDRKDQWSEDPNLCPSAQIPAVPHTFIQWIRNTTSLSYPSIDFRTAASRITDITAKISKPVVADNIIITYRNRLGSIMQMVIENMYLDFHPGIPEPQWF